MTGSKILFRRTAVLLFACRVAAAAATWTVGLLDVLTAARQPGERLLPNGISLNINYSAVPHPLAAVLTELSHGYNTYAVPLKPDVDFATTGNITVDCTFVPGPSNRDRKSDAEMVTAGYHGDSDHRRLDRRGSVAACAA